MVEGGHVPIRAAIGPGIGPCCFEVGEEVAGGLDRFRAQTTWGTTSVDLGSAIRSELPGIEIWSADSCTLHDRDWFSYRRDQTSARQATVGWLP
jgi:hypothetical protein